ncbi:MAG: hypothetical protein JRG74_15590 [Deltaproteobacteria bacterium]|nr:hypothetical protein [Deltaproteobacteria bacterium]
MKPVQLYKNLCELAEKAKSGFCKVKGKNLFIMDKNISVQKKIRILAEFLGKMPHENIYVMPAVRDILG